MPANITSYRKPPTSRHIPATRRRSGQNRFMRVKRPNSYSTTNRDASQPKWFHPGSGQKDAGLGNEQMARTNGPSCDPFGIGRERWRYPEVSSLRSSTSGYRCRDSFGIESLAITGSNISPALTRGAPSAPIRACRSRAQKSPPFRRSVGSRAI